MYMTTYNSTVIDSTIAISQYHISKLFQISFVMPLSTVYQRGRGLLNPSWVNRYKPWAWIVTTLKQWKSENLDISSSTT